MVLYFLTSSVLEIGTAITVWSIKQLYNGAVYLLSSDQEENDDNNKLKDRVRIEAEDENEQTVFHLIAQKLSDEEHIETLQDYINCVNEIEAYSRGAIF